MNMIKTGVLLAAMTALFAGIGFMIGGQGGMTTALIIAGVMNLGSFWFSDKIVLSLYGAKPVTSGEVYELTRDLAEKAGIPMPKTYIIDSPQPNAFATGRNPQHGAVAVTTGIMKILNKRELAGVIAHELAHIKNRDTLIMTLTATLAGAISMLANFFMFFGGGRDRPAGVIGSLAVMIIAPLAAMLVQMAISRVREYAADREGALICHDPMALASALEKLESSAKRIDNHVAEQNPATAHMFIVNPLHVRKTDNLFSTHPSVYNRVLQLREIAAQIPAPVFDAPDKKPFRNPWIR